MSNLAIKNMHKDKNRKDREIMHRNVEISVPMFIGIILLIGIVTTVLVTGINYFIGLTRESNEVTYDSGQKIQNYFDELDASQENQSNEDTLNSVLNQSSENETSYVEESVSQNVINNM